MKNFDRAVQIAEVVGAVAIIISLIYVGSEIRLNSLSAQNASAQAAIAMNQDLNVATFDPEFAAIVDAGIADYSSLAGTQKRQFDGYLASTMNIWEFCFTSHEKGLMDDDIWEGWERYIQSQFRIESIRQYWFSARQGYGELFQAYADALAGGG